MTAQRHPRKPLCQRSLAQNPTPNSCYPWLYQQRLSVQGPAVAQTLEEVIVVATKREQGVMDVPLAITALSGNFIEETNLNDVKDLIAYTPRCQR